LEYEQSYLLYAVTFPFLLFLSAFFSGTETAFFSLSKSTISILETDDSHSSKRVLKLLKNPQSLLVTILISNNIVNIVIATEATLITQTISQAYEWNVYLSLVVNVLIVTFLILIFGEILPKVLAIKDSLWFAKRSSLVISLLNYLLKPISYLFTSFSKIFTESLKANWGSQTFSEEELKTLFDISEETGAIENNEKEMITSIIDFSETTVKEIMVPRIDIDCIKSDATINELIDLINESLHSRIPVFQERIDNILGIIYVKDLLKYVANNKSLDKVKIDKIVHKAYFVPEKKKIQELLKEFQEQKVHMAIVVDEYGGTSGLVTLEDIIEEIVGEIQDEYDTEQPLIHRINEYTYILDGKLSIEELNEAISINLPQSEDIETISGFIYHKTGKLPDLNELILHENYQFKIKEIDNRRINKIELNILKEQQNQ
jgi:putative hemolysin